MGGIKNGADQKKKEILKDMHHVINFPSRIHVMNQHKPAEKYDGRRKVGDYEF